MAAQFTPENSMDLERFRIISDVLVSQFRNHKGIFKDHSLAHPENIFFKSDVYNSLSARQKVNASVFYGLFLTGGIESGRAMTVFTEILQEYPEWIEPGKVIEINQENVVKVLIDAGVGSKAESIANWWQHNSLVLKNICGNLKKTLADVDNYDLAFTMLGKRHEAEGYCGKKLGFKGFGSSGKVCTLILHNLQEQNLIPKFKIPISADIHAVSLYLRTGCLYPCGKNIFYTFSGLIRKASLKYLPDEWEYNADISRASYLLPKMICREYNPKEKIQPDLFDSRFDCLFGCALNDWCVNDVVSDHKKSKFEIKPR